MNSGSEDRPPDAFDYWHLVKKYIPATDWCGVALWYCAHQSLYFRLVASLGTRSLAVRGSATLRLKRAFGWYLVILGMAFYRLASLPLGSRGRPREGRNRIGIATQNHLWRSGRDGGSDLFYQSIIEGARARDLSVQTVSIWRNPGEYRSLVHRTRFGATEHVAMERYWQLGIAAKAGKWRKSIQGMIEAGDSGSNRDRFARLVEEDLISRLLPYFLPLMAQHVEMGRRWIREQHIDLLLLENEGGGWERSMLIASKLEGIPVLALQHGLITDDSPAHIFPPEAISQTGDYHSPFYQVPEKTAVYGPHYWRLLCQVSSYPPKSVVPVGQPRYDVMSRSSELYDRGDFLKRHGIEGKRGVVLLMTQPFLGESERYRLSELAARAVAGSGHALVVKPHPREKPGYYKNIVKAIVPDAILLDPRADAAEAIFASDVMVTGFSTTAIEAAVLRKPVVFVRTTAGSAESFIRSGLGIEVESEAQLRVTMDRLLSDDAFLAETLERQDGFLADHLAGADGHATERVLDLMSSLLGREEER